MSTCSLKDEKSAVTVCADYEESDDESTDVTREDGMPDAEG